jgi:hypothetical protein
VSLISKDTTFSLDNVVSNICMRHNVDGRTDAVLGIIRHRRTKARRGPPKCGNQFQTDKLPFAKGHVIALELGGSDHEFNVVPQFECWQGHANGEWRQMEKDLTSPQYNGGVMLVTIRYGRTGFAESPEDALDSFIDDRLRPWTDPRIPDGFTVRVWVGNATNPSAINTDADFLAAITTLGGVRSVFEKTFDLGTALPEPDRTMYIVQEAITIMENKHKKLKRTNSFVSFMLEPDTAKEIREELKEVKGVLPNEAASQQMYPIMYAAQAAVTGPKVIGRIKKRKADRLATVDEKDIGLPRK